MSIERKCANCNSPLSKYERKYCSYKCHFEFIKGKTYEELFGLENSIKLRKKLSEKHLGYKIQRENRICKMCNSTFICRITSDAEFCSKKCFGDFERGKTFEERYGPERAKIIKEKMIFSLKKAHLNAVGKHYEEILKQTKILEKDGFKCVPIGKVVPDIIAFKDNKIFAIEVEKSTPNWEKYTEDIRKYFDDIIWIIIRKDGQKMVKG